MVRSIIFLLFIVFYSIECHSQIDFQDTAAAVGLPVSVGNPSFGSGISLVDFNDDGWDDVTLATDANSNVRFFENNNGIFTEVFFPAVNMMYRTKAVTWIDIDNDDDKDLFVTSDTGSNRLFENQGAAGLVEITAASGLTTSGLESFGASWADVNNDKYLDLFVSVRSQVNSNKLYVNNGDNTFTDQTATSGISLQPRMSFCSAFFDFDNDGDQDLYVSNDKYAFENWLFQNDGTGNFTDLSVDSSSNLLIDAMSTTVGDYNNDGFFDIYVTNNPQGNILLKNNGNATFSDVTTDTGTSFDSVGWGAVFVDVDNDADQDLYVSGMFDGSNRNLLSAALYENNSNIFTIPTAPGLVADTGTSFSNAVSDFNQNGSMDIFVTNNNQENIFLWDNVSTGLGNWVKIRLTGKFCNKDGIGAVIKITCNGQDQYKTLLAGEGYLSQNSGTIHFGIGTNSIIDELTIYWPDGTTDSNYGINPNQVVNILQAETLSLVDNLNAQISLRYSSIEKKVHIISQEPIAEARLYSLSGTLIQKVKVLNSFNTEHLPDGLYIIKVSTIKDAMSIKFRKF
ncbi:MAG: FG-GAP-like repeat-containing protein [Nonlabens sp.]